MDVFENPVASCVATRLDRVPCGAVFCKDGKYHLRCGWHGAVFSVDLESGELTKRFGPRYEYVIIIDTAYVTVPRTGR